MSWLEEFFRFFRKAQRPLSMILDAEGCREGWLQGEFYRHFWTQENGFRVNCSHCDKRRGKSSCELAKCFGGFAK
jgi:hypothetical protein